MSGAPVWLAIILALLLAILALNAAGMRLRWASMLALCFLVLGLGIACLVIQLQGQDRSTTAQRHSR